MREEIKTGADGGPWVDGAELDEWVIEALHELERPADTATIAGAILGHRLHASKLANYKVFDLLEVVWLAIRRLIDQNRINAAYMNPPILDPKFIYRERAFYSLPVLDRLAEV